jgi:hypothetical protein
LSGTAATASFALTLGGTGSVGFATTGAFSATSGSASSRLTQIEQVYATTGSNSFRATQSITGSLTVTGQIIAQTLNVQQVTSSIVFSSGSNTFGCDLNSRQTFTGSVLMTGSLTVNTAGTEFQVTNTGINFGNALTDTHNISGSLRITGSVNHYIMGCNFGVGTITPTVRLESRNDSSAVYDAVTATTNRVLNLRNACSGTGYTSFLNFITEPNGEWYVGGVNKSNYSDLVFLSRDASYAERMRITSGGDVFINNSCGVSLNGLTNRLSVSSTTYNLFDISRFSDNAFGPNFYLVKSRNGTIGGNTSVVSGDNLGNINWVGATGGTGLTDAANIRAEVDGTPGTNDMPGRLMFSTTADGSSGPTERMRIDSSGGILFRGSTTASNGVYLSNDSSLFKMYAGDSTSSTKGFAFYVTNGSTQPEAMRITSGGNVGIGVVPKNYASSWAAAQIGSFSIMGPNPGTDPNAILGANVYRATDNTWKRIVTGYANLIEFNQGSGDIRTYTGGTNSADTTISFVSGPYIANGGVSWTNGSSDIRKKKNFESSQGLAEVLQIEAVKYHFNWDDDNSIKRLGFKAQNLQTLIPEMVVETGEFDEDGSPYLTITPDYILPVLVKAIQEQQCTICSQASIINTLKTCIGIA